MSENQLDRIIWTAGAIVFVVNVSLRIATHGEQHFGTAFFAWSGGVFTILALRAWFESSESHRPK